MADFFLLICTSNLKSELYLKTLLKCTFFPQRTWAVDTIQTFRSGLSTTNYLREMSVHTRYTVYRASGTGDLHLSVCDMAGKWIRSRWWKLLLHMHVNSGSGSARTRSSVFLDPLMCFICFPEIAGFSLTALMVNQILGSRLQPTPFLRSLRCQNMTHGFI